MEEMAQLNKCSDLHLHYDQIMAIEIKLHLSSGIKLSVSVVASISDRHG